MFAMTALSPPASSAADHDPIRSPTRLALRRFLANRLAVLGFAFLIFLVLTCFASLPWTLGSVNPDSPPRYADQLNLQHVRETPSRDFPMGTDILGRDLLARFLLGGAISLAIGLASALIAIFIGTAVGTLAGYVGGRTDAFLMRLVDVLYGLPYILLVILMRVALVPFFASLIALQWANALVLLIGIGSVSWLTLARVVRGQVLSLRDQPFIEAARALGLPQHRILLRHIVPNLIGTVVVYGTLTVPAAILSESFLSFLGLGIQAPLPSWGNLASDGIDALNPINIRYWLILWPCIGLSLALLSLNFFGDGVRDALDPKVTG